LRAWQRATDHSLPAPQRATFFQETVFFSRFQPTPKPTRNEPQSHAGNEPQSQQPTSMPTANQDQSQLTTNPKASWQRSSKPAGNEAQSQLATKLKASWQRSSKPAGNEAQSHGNEAQSHGNEAQSQGKSLKANDPKSKPSFPFSPHNNPPLIVCTPCGVSGSFWGDFSLVAGLATSNRSLVAGWQRSSKPAGNEAQSQLATKLKASWQRSSKPWQRSSKPRKITQSQRSQVKAKFSFLAT
jgi:hypothetical protein